MHIIQAGLDHFEENIEDTLTFHYNNYDRDYENGGYIDEFLSESFVAKVERRIKKTNKISFGLGSDYKYDWGSFVDNGSWSTPSVKGNINNLGFFGNTGYKFSENTILILSSVL